MISFTTLGLLEAGRIILAHNHRRQLIITSNNHLLFQVWEEVDGRWEERQTQVQPHRPTSHTQALVVANCLLMEYIANTGGMSCPKLSVRIRHAG